MLLIKFSGVHASSKDGAAQEEEDEDAPGGCSSIIP
jgi:hypothetical protein